MTIARKIQRARKRSRRPRLLKAETLDSGGASEGCFSGSAEADDAGSAERGVDGVGGSIVWGGRFS